MTKTEMLLTRAVLVVWPEPVDKVAKAVLVQPVDKAARAVPVRPVDKAEKAAPVQPVDKAARAVPVQPVDKAEKAVLVQPVDKAARAVCRTRATIRDPPAVSPLRQSAKPGPNASQYPPPMVRRVNVWDHQTE